MKLSVNGDKRQETPISDLLFDVSGVSASVSATSVISRFQVAHIVSFLSQGSTLRRGAVIMTGTPSGVGCTGPEWKYLQHDDKLELEVSQIGVLRHTIAYE
jgi:2-keto-4-pentenoate hydratase/2-oxohepta-3-ene-1,7-dioic acid hydratase in catechol pathway